MRRSLPSRTLRFWAVPGSLRAAAIAEADVEIAVRAEDDLAAVVVIEGLATSSSTTWLDAEAVAWPASADEARDDGAAGVAGGVVDIEARCWQRSRARRRGPAGPSRWSCCRRGRSCRGKRWPGVLPVVDRIETLGNFFNDVRIYRRQLARIGNDEGVLANCVNGRGMPREQRYTAEMLSKGNSEVEVESAPAICKRCSIYFMVSSAIMLQDVSATRSSASTAEVRTNRASRQAQAAPTSKI